MEPRYHDLIRAKYPRLIDVHYLHHCDWAGTSWCAANIQLPQTLQRRVVGKQLGRVDLSAYELPDSQGHFLLEHFPVDP